MKAAIITPDGSFTLADHATPAPREGCALVSVTAAGIGPTDLMRAKGFFGPVTGAYVPGGEGVHGVEAFGVRLAGESRQQLQHRRALRSVPADNRLELRGRSASPANDDDRRCRGVARLEGRWHVGAEEGIHRIRNLCGRVAVPQRTELPCGRGLGLRLWLWL